MGKFAEHNLTGLVRFRPTNQSIEPVAGETLLDCAQRAAVPLSSSCGGAGTCLSCMIQLKDCELPEPTDADRRVFSRKSLAAGWRRACQVWPRGGCTVHVPAKSAAVHIVRTLDDGNVRISPDPTVKTWRIAFGEPNHDPSLGDDDRLMAVINRRVAGRCRSIDPHVLRGLPDLAAEGEARLLVAIRHGELVNAIAADRSALALAVDLGTTSIGGYLVDLRRGRTCAKAGVTNPQGVLGGDVVTRLTAAVRDGRRLEELQRLAISGINRLIYELCRQADAQTGDICDVVVAGNSPMQHFLLGLPVDGLARAPFVSLLRGPADLKARALQIDAGPGAWVHTFPGIAGFVGGDHVAALLALESRGIEGVTLLLDIGTNTEISLLHEGAILTVSCPSGPALEGGEITWGMQAAQGAIESCAIRGGDWELGVIGRVAAEGICGSGVVDIMAALLMDGAINHRGRLQSAHPRVRDTEEGRELLLVAEEERDAPAIVFTQADVRSVQLAKAAIRSGVDMLLDAAGIGAGELDRVVVAGAFGNFISIESAVAIGMLPELPRSRFEQIGDAAGLGARLAALSHPHRARAALIARDARHIGMAGNREFQKRFMRRINFSEGEGPAVRT